VSARETFAVPPGVLVWRNEPYAITTDTSTLDTDLIHRVLSREFWDAAGLTPDLVVRSLERSICFGVYEESRQIGFARVVTDAATFAFICDDFIVESHRGRGLGKWLMQCVLSHPDLQGLHRVMLVTRDPRLYLKMGFTPLAEPEAYMELSATPPLSG
jgi:GNAT superfamily N-acetyltransferase